MHKYIGYSDIFCWHCGKRVHVGKKYCPHCWARYNSYGKRSRYTYPVKRRITPSTGLGPFHPTMIRFFIKYLIGCIITGAIVCGIIYMIEDYDEGVYETICLILCSFWVLWLVWYFLSKALAVPSLHRKNTAKAAHGESLSCATCHNQIGPGDNYCDLCGTIVFVDHDPKFQPPITTQKPSSL